MRHDALMDMSLTEIDAYAQACGIDVTGERTKARKVALLEERRSRVADVPLLGVTVAVPVRRMRDQRVAQLLEPPVSEHEGMEALRLVLGDEQCDAVVGRCTDDDGVVDANALSFALNTLLTSDELKNY